MPALIATPLTAHVRFPLPRSKLTNLEQYGILDASSDAILPGEKLLPNQQETIPVFDLRPDLEAGALETAKEQLDKTGFAAIKAETVLATEEKLSSVDGTNAYLAEQRDMLKTLLGASKVIVWNSVVRRADVAPPAEFKQRQQLSLEKAAAPSSSASATAGSAHVDQDEAYGRTIIRRATADEGVDPFEKYSRLQIVNIWRPLGGRGVVSNKPLLVGDFSSLNVERDVMRMAGSFGGAYGVAYHPEQRWNYIQHQQSDEALLLRCYDSNQGANGEALYTPHVAAEAVFDEPIHPDLVDKPEIPRMSVEIRMIVLTE